MTRHKVYNTKRWKELRAQVLTEEPVCHWCRKAPSTEADHLIELARDDGADPYDRANIVGSCKPCNSARGRNYQARAREAKKRGVFLEAKQATPLLHTSLSPETAQNGAGSSAMASDVYRPGEIAPRLVTPSWGGNTWGGQIAAWAKANLDIELYPWQRQVLDGAFEVDDQGALRHRWGLVSTARQNGKTVLLAAVIGWYLTEGVVTRGEPQSVLSIAHKLDTAEMIGHMLFPKLEERYGFKTYNSSGRMQATNGDTIWRIQSATPRSGHGTSNTLLVVDELWECPEIVLDAGLLPTQRARRHPFALMLSTAGTEASKAFIRWREKGMQAIERDKPDRLYMAEWSPPANSDPTDRSIWHYSNPALDLGELTMQDIEDGFNSPNRDAWLRSDLNLWTSAVGAWLPPGTFEQLEVNDPMPDGGVLSVDADLTELRYVGVRAATREDKRLQVVTEFLVESTAELWAEIERVMADKTVKLNLTPQLAAICPTELSHRMDMVGMREMSTYTSVVRNLILEGMVVHCGQLSLTEHVNRAVAGRTGATITLTSQKSPGPIEQARCLVWSCGTAARPTSNIRKPMIGASSPR